MSEAPVRKKLKFWRSVTVAYYMLILFLLLSPPDSYPNVQIPLIDKIVHVGMFLILGGLLQYIVWHPHRALKMGILLSGVSELLQAFTPARTVDPFDFIADVCGVLLGILILEGIWHAKRPAP